MTDTLLTRLFLDAQDELLAAVDHIPEPGRHGPLGTLSAPGRVVAHMAWSQDMWIQRFCAGAPLDPWTAAWWGAQVQTPDIEVAPPLDEAREAFVRVAERAAAWVQAASRESLLGNADLTGTSYEAVPTARAYMVARSIAHLFVHAGELNVIGAMVRADDLGLPGALPRSSMATDAVDWTVPIVAALLQDGYVELGRAAAVAPQPAVTGAVDRFNPLSYTLLHVMNREDSLWNEQLNRRPPHWWLAENRGLLARDAGPRDTEIDWDTTLEMAAEVVHATSNWLPTVDEQTGARPMMWGSRETEVGVQLARSAGHVFSHASEMLAISSQFGTEDLGMPGALEHVREATSGWTQA